MAYEKYLNKKVRQRFDQGWFEGKIVSTPDNMNKKKIFFVVFEDKDTGEYDLEEIKLMILSKEKQLEIIDSVVGQKIKKLFGTEWFEGVVQPHSNLFLITYEDGDAETMNLPEVLFYREQYSQVYH